MKHGMIQACAILLFALTIAPSFGDRASSTSQQTMANGPVVILAQGGAVRECPVDKNGKPYCGNNCPLCK